MAGDSTLEIVLAALNLGGDAKELNADSFAFLLPNWNAEADEPRRVATEVSIQRVTFDGERVKSKVEDEEGVTTLLKSSSSKEEVYKGLKAYIKNVKGGFRLNLLDVIGYAKLLMETGVEDEELDALFVSSCGAMSRRMVTEILRWCVKTDCWEPVYHLVSRGVVSANEYPELIDRIVELGNIPLICLCIYRIRDIQPSQWLQILILFLENPSRLRQSFELQRKVWQQVVAAYIEKTVACKSNLSTLSGGDEARAKCTRELETLKAGSIKLAAAFDCFSSSELCLHLYFGSSHDEAVLSAIISELDISHVTVLLRYLSKWLDQYTSKLIHIPRLKREERRLVPSVGTVANSLGLILEAKYMSFTLKGEMLGEELAAMAKNVNSLVAVGKTVNNLGGVVQHLVDKKSLPSETVEAADHIIEYLEF